MSAAMNTAMGAKIYLVHAGEISMDPFDEALRAGWPGAQVAHLLEDSLSPDFNRDNGLTPAMVERFRTLGNYCAAAGADAILFTCSMFGAAIDAVKRDQRIPVLKPNEAVYDAMLQERGSIVLLSTFDASLKSMMAEVDDAMRAAGVRLDLRGHVVPGALDALVGGRPGEHNALIAEAVASFAGCDMVAFGQASMTRALPLAQVRARRPIVSAPHSAVGKLRRLMHAAPLETAA